MTLKGALGPGRAVPSVSATQSQDLEKEALLEANEEAPSRGGPQPGWLSKQAALRPQEPWASASSAEKP